MRSVAIMMLTAAALSPGMARAQGFQAVAADPNMPIKEGFDTDRAIFWRLDSYSKCNKPPDRTPQRS